MTFANIQKALDIKLKALPSCPYISWPNTQFKPANNNLYIRPTLLMSKTDLYTLNTYNRFPGIYQIDVFGQLNRGVQQVYSMADEIKSHFETDKTLIEDDTILLIQEISLGAGTREEAWYHIYVQINFLAFN